MQSPGEVNSFSAGLKIPAFYGAHMFINILTKACPYPELNLYIPHSPMLFHEDNVTDGLG